MINSIPQLSLQDSDTIPQLGFGVIEVPPQDTAVVLDKSFDLFDLELSAKQMEAIGSWTSASKPARTASTSPE